ncbi:hypothetical protein [Bradyrhizobium sp. UFLA05-112]
MLLPICLGACTYLFFFAIGDYLLQDSDTYWHIKIGQWIIDNRALPYSDVYSFTRLGEPWTSSAWLSEVLYAAAYSSLGWGGPVILASLAIAATVAISVYLLTAHLGQVRAVAIAMLALAMSMHHLIARPHVLAMPIMVAFVGGLMAAADRRSAPSWLLLPLVPLWVSIHGGFVLGLVLIGPIGLEALWAAKSEQRLKLAIRWALFGIAAVAATCATPYGWHSPLGAFKILGLGELLSNISEWKSADFSSFSFFEGALLFLIGMAFYRGLVLSPPRIMLLLGLIWMALTHNRHIEVFAFLAPLVLAKPFVEQSVLAGNAAIRQNQERSSPYITMLAVLTIVAAGSTSTVSYLARHSFTFGQAHTPAAAVEVLQQQHVSRIFNQPEFGGYLISQGMRPFMDGRAELYGEKFVMRYAKVIEGRNVKDLLALLDEYKIEATLFFADFPAPQILDHIPGWKRIYTDDRFAVHIRENRPQAGAAAALESPNEPATRPAPVVLEAPAPPATR